MPKIVKPEDAKDKWNFYMPLGLKIEMHKKLLELGLQRKQSALIRALIKLFVQGEIDEDKLTKLIEEETYITATGKQSIL